MELFSNFLESHLFLRVLSTDELVPCDLWTDVDLQRRHLAGGVQLGLAPRLVLIHVRLPYWKTQPCLLFSLGWFWEHNALVRHHAAYTSHGIVLLTQLEPRYVPIHRRFYDKTACESSRSLVQENVQSSFLILGFRLPRSYSDTILSKSRKISRQLSVNDAAHTLTRSAQMCHAPFLTFEHRRRHFVCSLFVELCRDTLEPTRACIGMSAVDYRVQVVTENWL